MGHTQEYMYTLDGVKIKIIKQLENGWLGNKMMTGFDHWTEDEQEEYEYQGEEVVFFDNLLEKAPIEKLDEDFQKLSKHRLQLSKESEALQIEINKKSSILKSLDKFPILYMLNKYLTKDFNFVLYVKDLTVQEASRFYQSNHVRTANIKKEGWVLYKMQSENYTSSDDRQFLVFDNMEDLKKEACKIALELINKFSNNYNPLVAFDNTMKNLSDDSGFRKNKDVIQAIEKKRAEMMELHKNLRTEAIQKKKDELQKAIDEMEQLTKVD